MPTLLRLLMVAITSALTFGGAVVLAIPRPPSGFLLLGGIALAALTLPPLLAGSFASYWAWEGAAHRRLRIAAGILAAVQLAGALALVLLTSRDSIVAIAVLVVAALAVDPILLLIGRAARRRDDATGSRVADGADRDVIDGVRRGRRRAGIGATIGLAIGIAVLLVLGLGSRDLAFATALLLYLPACAGLGASTGALTVTFALAGRIRDLLGGGYSSSRRIGLAVKGRAVELSEEESDRAARYASVAPGWLELQLVAQLGSLTGSVCVLLGVALRDADIRWEVGAFLALALLVLIPVAVMLHRQLGRIRTYAAAHPVAA